MAAGALYVGLAVVLGLTGDGGAAWWWPVVGVAQGLVLVALGARRLRELERARPPSS